MHTARKALLRQAIDAGLASGPEEGKPRRPRGMEPLRPGRLLNVLVAMEGELAKQGQAHHAATLQRLAAIRMAALGVLQGLAGTDGEGA